MTVATAAATTSQRRSHPRRTDRMGCGADVLAMAASLILCGVLFTAGGLEAILFSAAGAVLGVRNAKPGAQMQGACSGGFAGLFVGALFAAFFHSALAAALANIARLS